VGFGRARRAARIPVVYDAHTLLASELPYYGPGLLPRAKRTIGRRLDHWLPKRSDHIIAVTEVIAGKLMGAGIDPDRISVVPNGVECEHFHISGAARPPAIDRKTVLFAGNLARYQGIELLLQAFARVVRVKPDVRLVIAAARRSLQRWRRRGSTWFQEPQSRREGS
jgi:glycosyltransferase involved in cell wall biosynthesis